MLAFRKAMICIAAVALLALAVHASIGAGSEEGGATSHAVSVNASGEDAASIPDFDGDGTVGFSDFLAFAGSFGTSEGDSRYEARFDLNGDGEIGFADFLIFAENFGKEAPSPVVTIPDPNLRAAIEKALGKASGAPITQAEMATLYGEFELPLGGWASLDLQSLSISDLTGLEFAVNLTGLLLNVNRGITDVSPLANLTNLEDLALGGNRITDVSALSGLTNLKFLGLSENNLTDVSGLSSLTKLIALYLDDNNLTDVSPLANLTRLQQLWLNGNRITDVSALADLTNLGQLWLDGNNLTDISALAGLTRLNDLNLNGNRIADASVLSGLTDLNELGLGVTDVTDLSALMNLSNLTRLELRGAPLNASSIDDQIPALEGRGVTVLFDALRPRGDFDIELIFLDAFTEAQKRVIRYAASRWMSIIRDDLPDYEFALGWSSYCADRPIEISPGERIDDLRIYVITNEGRWAYADVLRDESFLPVVGCMSVGGSGFDTEIHEIAHTLGFGTVWEIIGFLKDPDGDAHFNGPLAIAAFDDAGGRDYTGAKVPVPNSEEFPGYALSHWRHPLLKGEVMCGGQTPRGTTPLSAITIQSLADMGYTVDVTQADPYTLPEKSAGAKIAASARAGPSSDENAFGRDEAVQRVWGRGARSGLTADGQAWESRFASPTHTAPELTCGAGLLNEPIYVVDPQGRVVRTIDR